MSLMRFLLMLPSRSFSSYPCACTLCWPYLALWLQFVPVAALDVILPLFKCSTPWWNFILEFAPRRRARSLQYRSLLHFCHPFPFQDFQRLCYLSLSLCFSLAVFLRRILFCIHVLFKSPPRYPSGVQHQLPYPLRITKHIHSRSGVTMRLWGIEGINKISAPRASPSPQAQSIGVQNLTR